MSEYSMAQWAFDNADDSTKIFFASIILGCFVIGGIITIFDFIRKKQ